MYSFYKILEEAKKEDADLDNLIQEIIFREDVFDLFRLYNEVERLSIDKIVDEVLKTNNLDFIYCFAQQVKNGELTAGKKKEIVNKIAEAVVDMKGIYVNYLINFSSYIDYAPVDLLMNKATEIVKGNRKLHNMDCDDIENNL